MKKICFLFTVLLIIVFALVSCHDDPVVKVQQTPTIRGSVSIPEGSGLTGSDFFVRVMEGEKAVYTGKVGSNGSFSVTGLKEDVSYSLLLTTEEPGDIKGTEKEVSRAATSGYGGWLSDVTASVDDQTNIGSVKVKPLGTIRGVVKRDGAEDGYDTTIYIPGTSYMAMTDADGNFSIFNVPQATYTLRYISSGYLARMVEGIVLYSESATENPVITVPDVVLIQNAGIVEGYAVFDEGADSTGISVKLESSDGLQNYVQLTSSNGFYRFAGVVPGTYRIVASYANYPSQVSEVFSVSAATTSVVGEKLYLLENIGTITGSASLSDNPNVTSGITILFENFENGRTYATITGESGIFSKAVKPGTYKVTASYAGYSSQSQDVFVSQNSTVSVVIPSLLLADGAISGKVVLEGSLDAGGAIVTVVCASDESVKASTITAADGSYSFTGLKKAGQYYVTVTKDGYVKNTSGMAYVSLGTVYNAPSISLRSLVSNVSGKVTLNDDSVKEYTGINVMLRADDGSVQYDATTDQEGNYILNGVLPGKYTFYVSKAGYVDKVVKNITVESAVDKVLESVILQIGVRSVTGSVELELRDDHAGALITATNLADETVYSAISNSDGLYTLSGMKPGQYRVVITNTNYRTATLKTINVVESNTLELPLERLEIARGTISGVVTLEGRTSSNGILVELVGTDYSTYTNDSGEYSFYVPEGNYAGVRFSREDYKTESESLVISLFADNYFPIQNEELEATHVSVFGNVSVSKADDNFGVNVEFEDYDVEPIVTDADGFFQFDHVPVGTTYTLRFKRENTADITVKVETKASDGIRIKDVVMVPDAAGIEGLVKLENGINNGNVTVKIDTGKEELSTTTNYAGSYYLGGIPTGKEFTVEYSKDGWTSETQAISALEPLEVRTLDDVTMVDVTAPILNKIEINGGATVTGSKLVSVLIDAEDKGSGLSEMRYYWGENTAFAEIMNYARMIKVELPGDANAEYTLTVDVWDNAGNKSSSSASDAIELVGQITTIQGILSAEDLHWTTDKNPIVIMGDVTVPTDKTLEIDPGVDVFFAGNYSIIVSGKIKAVGTEDMPIVFDSTKNHLSEEYFTDSVEAYDGYWNGIVVNTNDLEVKGSDDNTFTLVNGSILSYCNIYNLANGITGRAFINHCRIETKKSALGKYSDGERFRGYVLNSYISGGVAIDDWSNYSIYGNVFDGTDLLKTPEFSNGNHWDYGTHNWVAMSWYEEYWDDNGIYHSQRFNEFDFNGLSIEGSYYLKNNRIIGYNAISLRYLTSIQFNSFESCRSIMLHLNNGNNKSFRYNEFTDITDTIRIGGEKAFTFNNFNSISDSNTITVVESNNTTLDFSSNYWGAHTSELQTIEKYATGYSTFLNDGHVTSGTSIIDWSNYATAPWSFAGFRGDNVVDLVISDRITETAMDEDVVIPFRSTGDRIDYVRYSQNTGNLNSIPWTVSDGSSITIPVSEIDMNKVSSDGYLTFYVQGKSGNEETPVSIVTVARDYPRITDMSLSTDKATDDSSVTLYYRLSDAQSYGGGSDGKYARLYLDDIVVTEWADRYFSDYNHSCGIEPYRYMNGEHTLKLVVADQAGNETSADIPFAIERAVPTTEGLTFDGDTILPEDGTLDVSLEIKNAKRLNYVRFYSDGVRVYEKYCYSDNAGNTRQESYKLDAHYLKAGTHTLYVELEDYGGNTTRTIDYEYTVEGDPSGPVIGNLSVKDGDVIGSNFWTNAIITAVKGVKSFSAYLDDYCLWNGYWGDEYTSERNRIDTGFSRNMGDMADGEHALILKATDYAGNTTEQTIKVNLQKSWPTVKLSVYDKMVSFAINTEISDVSSVKRVSVYANDSLIGTYNLASEYNYWSKDITKAKALYPAGEYVISLELTNYAGEAKFFNSDKKVKIEENIEFTENYLEGVTTISGVLNVAERLHWTAEKSPWVVTGNITVASGKTLVIDPGVEVLFEGDYSINAKGGNIDARGTEEAPIIFRSSANHVENHDGYYAGWSGINMPDSLSVHVDGYSCSFNSGSILEYCQISDLSDGITGRAYIRNCSIESSGYAVGKNNGNNFNGVLLNNQINGSVRINDNLIVFGNRFNGNSAVNSNLYIWNHTESNKIVNNDISDFDSADLYLYYCMFEFNTMKDFSGNIRVWRYENSRGTKYNEFDNISGTIYLESPSNGFQYGSFTNLKGNPQIYVDAGSGSSGSFDLSYNYWGAAGTAELRRAEASAEMNASFIHDGYDQSNLALAVWDGFVSEAWEYAGYKGDGFIDFEATLIQEISTVNEIKIGNDIPFKLTLKSGGIIGEYRIAQSIEELLNNEWIPYAGYCTLDAEDIDTSALIDGTVKAFIQIRTDSGFESAPVACAVSYDVPTITFNAIKDGDVITSSSLIPIQADFYDASNYTHFMTYIDGVIKCEGGYGYLSNGHYNIWGGYPWTTDPANMGENDYLDPAIYGNGVHTLTIFAEDRVGNSTTTVVNFTIQITPPTLTAVEFVGGSSIGEGETLKISVRIDDAENLASVRLLSDGKEIVTKDTTQRLPTFSEIFSLSSDYLRSGTHSIQIIMDDRSGESYASDLFEYTAEGDDSAPTIEGFDVGEGHVFTENSVEVWTLDVTDDTGIKSIFFDIDGVHVYQYSARDVETSEKTYEAKARFKVYGFGNGNHVLTVKASDFAGNETVITRTVAVNKTLPTTTLYKRDETDEYLRYYATISRRGWIRDGYILMDGEILQYWNINSNSDESYGDSYWTDYLYRDSLPSGTHVLQAVFYTQGGDKIESNELTFTNSREKNDSRYGLNKTWNADGTLIADSRTVYLWNFDEDNGVNYESVSGKNLGSVNALTEGLGSKAGSLYYDTSDQMSFFNSEWTVEYWSKDEYGGTDNITVYLRGILNSYNYHYSTNSESYINAEAQYYMGNSEDYTSSQWMTGARSSRADRSAWHHYAIVSTGDRFEIYMDGVLTYYTSGNQSSKKTSSGLYISMTSLAYVDELRISDTARSGDELWDYVQYVKNNNLLPE